MISAIKFRYWRWRQRRKTMKKLEAKINRQRVEISRRSV